MVADVPCIDVRTLEGEWRDALIAKDEAALRRLIHPQYKLVGIRSTGSVAVDLDQWITALRRMSVAELRKRYAEVFGERARSGHRQWLFRRIAWRVQALAYGDLSERARARARELANDADLRLTPPRTGDGASVSDATRRRASSVLADDRLPMAGTLLTRPYKGRTLVVEVLADGFEFAGKRYPSLSAVAKAATGSHWNGFHFFGLADNKATAR